jgi:hypothetical protein
MGAARLRWVFVPLAASIFAASAAAEFSYVAADPGAPPVTRENLMTSERFWPYQVELRAAGEAEGGGPPLSAGSQGVLVRVDASGRARIDFGRDGVLEVPIESTDVVERANQVRLGELWKPAPNLVHAIARRLVDPKSDVLQSIDFLAAYQPPGFLVVFADPIGADFAELAAALAPLRDRHGVMTLLCPQGAQRVAARTIERLRALDWSVPFVRDDYAPGYTASLLPDGGAPPAIALLTREGRVVFSSPWRPGLAADLTSALDGEFARDVAAGEAGPR